MSKPRSWLCTALCSVAALALSCGASPSDAPDAPAGALAAPVAAASSARAEPIPDGLLENERNTIQIFRDTGDSVVFITNARRERDFLSLNVTEVPQGSG